MCIRDRDMVLYDCRTIGHSGATYKALEYCGEAIRALPMDCLLYTSRCV